MISSDRAFNLRSSAFIRGSTSIDSLAINIINPLIQHQKTRATFTYRQTDGTQIVRMPADMIIRENQSDPCHPCSLLWLFLYIKMQRLLLSFAISVPFVVSRYN